MTGTSKRKGDRWERAVVESLRRNGYPTAERSRAGYLRDYGDVQGVVGIVVQCKDVASPRWSDWLDDLDEQVRAAGADHGYLAVKRRGRPDGDDGLAVMRHKDFVALLRAAGYGDERPVAWTDPAPRVLPVMVGQPEDPGVNCKCGAPWLSSVSHSAAICYGPEQDGAA